MTRRVALETIALMLLVSVLIFRGSRTRSEASATLDVVEQPQPSEIPTPPTAAKRLLSIAVRHAYEPPLLDEKVGRVFRVDVLRNRDLMLVCKAENDALAVKLCDRTVKEATATGLFRDLERAHETTPLARRFFDAAWPALLAAFGWFLVRTSFKPRAGGPEAHTPREPTGEWQSWSIPSRHTAVAMDDALPAGSTSARASPQRRGAIVHTMVGMPALRPAGGPLMAAEIDISARRPPFDTRTTARMLRVAPREARTRSAAPPTSTTLSERERRRNSTTPDLSRRVLYHVSGAPWTADSNVVHNGVLEQLASLREEIGKSASTRGCVIRVTGSSNSRHAKTQIAIQLAWSLIERDHSRVLLMEADLDAPALHKALRVNVPRGFGCSEQLERMRDEGDEGDGPPTVIRIAPALHVLVEGRSGSPALFDSPQFSAALAQLRSVHPVIVLDGPVVDTWPDPQSLRDIPDIVVFVVPSSTALSEAMAMSNRHFEHHPMLRVVNTGG